MNTNAIDMARRILADAPALSTKDLAHQLQLRDQTLSYLDAVHAADRASRQAKEDTARHVAAANAAQVPLGDEEPVRFANSVVLKRGTSGLPIIDKPATTERIARDNGFDHATAMNETERLARSVSASSTPSRSTATFELASRLVREGLMHADAQNVATTILKDKGGAEDFNAKKYTDGRAAGHTHARALTDAWRAK
jgi:hypothetical protein